MSRFAAHSLALALAFLTLPAQTADAQLWPAKNRLLVSPQSAVAGAKFGETLAAGDFNGDGYDDLVVGEPFRTISGGANTGAITLWLGGPKGLAESYHQHASVGVADDRYGAAFAVGNFDSSDAADELAVGMPGFNQFYDGTSRANSGYVWILDWSGSFLVPVTQVSQAPLGVESNPEADDIFGAALAAGDFDDDGDDDLAVGSPGEDLTIDAVGYVQIGMVHVFESSDSGLDASAATTWSYGSAIGSLGQSNQFFGQALAAGRLNDDDFEDLAIGVPQRNDGMVAASAGEVWVFFGTSTGLDTAGADHFTEDSAGQDTGSSHRFGAALAAGDLDENPTCRANTNCVDELIIGVPYADAPTDIEGAGYVYIFAGKLSGPDPELRAPILQSGFGGETNEAGDHLGFAFGVGYVDAEEGAELFVGSPDETSGATAQGMAHLVWGNATPVGNALLRAQVPYNSGPPAADDRFGAAFATGDFDGSGTDDVAIGIPGRDVSGMNAAGAVQIIYSGLFGDGFEVSLAPWSNF